MIAYQKMWPVPQLLSSKKSKRGLNMTHTRIDLREKNKEKPQTNVKFTRMRKEVWKTYKKNTPSVGNWFPQEPI